MKETSQTAQDARLDSARGQSVSQSAGQSLKYHLDSIETWSAAPASKKLEAYFSTRPTVWCLLVRTFLLLPSTSMPYRKVRKRNRQRTNNYD